ncbi:Protein of unknown function [Pyronema omphalodes CBS 100304]|uniref:Uncharacterized protein n=1 Tax=Pyronema omphalodes (strain CBS 100304) TaxID=1076935 RepID=U4LI02_PYROM|nr:Protein of unknown function [Pyronema omphalodes CBS 100304]
MSLSLTYSRKLFPIWPPSSYSLVQLAHSFYITVVYSGGANAACRWCCSGETPEFQSPEGFTRREMTGPIVRGGTVE